MHNGVVPLHPKSGQIASYCRVAKFFKGYIHILRSKGPNLISMLLHSKILNVGLTYSVGSTALQFEKICQVSLKHSKMVDVQVLCLIYMSHVCDMHMKTSSTEDFQKMIWLAGLL